MSQDDATRRQIAAANPGQSAWLSANAGSGKTRVLTNRVARLLLDQVPPQNILCLTYTKAAASEMQNRLFETLGAWAMSRDDDLRDQLSDLGVQGVLSAERLATARRLFAQAIETPGGLRIQTIHAFCAALLRRFPLEAGVSPQFTELDARTLSALCQDVLDEMASAKDTSAIDGLATYLSTDDLGKLTADVLKHRDAFSPALGFADLLQKFGLPAGFDDAALLRSVFVGGEEQMLAELQAVLQAGSVNDTKAALKLAPYVGVPLGLPALEALEGVLLNERGKNAGEPKVGTFPTKPSQAKLGAGVCAALEDLMHRVRDARLQRISLNSVRKTHALHVFADAFLPAVAARKRQHGWLDFDDLILKARDLLSDKSAAEWVLFKLDGGIDHILVDEAQDTSPEQWQVIQNLAREFMAGEGARTDILRTIFVVGDRKQSIYSFQGANPDEFDRLQDEFDTGLRAVNSSLATGTMEHSFRSAPAILKLVDDTFAAGASAGLGGPPHHIAFKHDLPGRVDLWPVVETPEKPPEPEWFEPVDKQSPQSEHARLADQIAAEIDRLIQSGETLPESAGVRVPMTAGDVLILVQRRSHMFRELIRACKEHGLPLAGADRLVLTRDLAVRDLLALLGFLSLPEDDLSLAAALRSPLFGVSEDELFRIAHGRKGYLWQALRQSPRHTEILDILDDLLRVSDYLRPYDLLERILNRHHGREQLIARLGPDCEEAVDALLGEALIYEQSDVPGLTGFLEWMQADEVEIKRQSEGSGGRLRIMTVHGAKGLEEKVVILPDCAKRKPSEPAEILMPDGDWPAWKPRSDAMPQILADAKTAWQGKQDEERMRLLYVAMTRAKVWLWVCAAGSVEIGWYKLIREGMQTAGALPHDFQTGQGLRLETGDWATGVIGAQAAPPIAAATLPSDVAQHVQAPRRPATPAPLSPSSLGGAKALPSAAGQDEAAALRHGSEVHLLLERLPELPEASWQAASEELLGAAAGPAALTEATRVLTHPALAELFDPSALSEVTVTADLPTLGRRVHGIIDRLVVSPGNVLVVDFKTNATVPESAEDTPEGILRQMGAYSEALSEVYPAHRIDTAILWTRTACLMPLPYELTAAALARSTPE